MGPLYASNGSKRGAEASPDLSRDGGVQLCGEIANADWCSSFFLVLWQPFRFGQTVEILPENLKGRVTKSNLMFTTLHEDNGKELQIPNNLFFQKMFRVGDQPTTPTAGSRQHSEVAPLAPEKSVE